MPANEELDGTKKVSPTQPPALYQKLFGEKKVEATQPPALYKRLFGNDAPALTPTPTSTAPLTPLEVGKNIINNPNFDKNVIQETTASTNPTLEKPIPLLPEVQPITKQSIKAVYNPFFDKDVIPDLAGGTRPTLERPITLLPPSKTGATPYGSSNKYGELFKDQAGNVVNSLGKPVNLGLNKLERDKIRQETVENLYKFGANALLETGRQGLQILPQLLEAPLRGIRGAINFLPEGKGENLKELSKGIIKQNQDLVKYIDVPFDYLGKKIDIDKEYKESFGGQLSSGVASVVVNYYLGKKGGGAISKVLSKSGLTISAESFIGQTVSKLPWLKKIIDPRYLTAVVGESILNTNSDVKTVEDNALKNGATPDEAFDLAQKTYARSLPIYIAFGGITSADFYNVPITKLIAKSKLDKFEKQTLSLGQSFGKGFLQEGPLQEGGQQIISNINTGRPIFEGYENSALIGGLLGGVLNLSLRSFKTETTIAEREKTLNEITENFIRETGITNPAEIEKLQILLEYTKLNSKISELAVDDNREGKLGASVTEIKEAFAGSGLSPEEISKLGNNMSERYNVAVQSGLFDNPEIDLNKTYDETNPEIIEEPIVEPVIEPVKEESLMEAQIRIFGTKVSKSNAENQEVVEDGNDLILKHGSPYDFDKFLLDKIGTGEGNQAFGYGLYFTENTNIAKNYAKKLSEDKTGIIYDIRIKNGLRKEFPNWREPLDEEQEYKLVSSLTEEQRKQYDKYVNDEYDKDEPREYVGSLGEIEVEDGGVVGYEFDKPSASGAIYQDLQAVFGQERATEIFQNAGISGIRYKSKKGFGNDYNYVVFDANSIEIIKKSNEVIQKQEEVKTEEPVKEETKIVEEPVKEEEKDVEYRVSKIYNTLKKSSLFKDQDIGTEEDFTNKVEKRKDAKLLASEYVVQNEEDAIKILNDELDIRDISPRLNESAFYEALEQHLINSGKVTPQITRQLAQKFGQVSAQKGREIGYINEIKGQSFAYDVNAFQEKIQATARTVFTKTNRIPNNLYSKEELDRRVKEEVEAKKRKNSPAIKEIKSYQFTSINEWLNENVCK